MQGRSEISGESTTGVTSNVRVEDLFYSSRILERCNIFKIILYFPFGLLLLLIRLIAGTFGLLILSLLPKSTYTRRIFKGVCKILGVVVRVDDKYFDDSAKILIANHVSILDRIAVNTMVPCNTICQDFQIKRMGAVSFWKDADIRYCRELNDDDIAALQAYIEASSVPVLSFPEGATTNGRVGLLKFHPAVFSLNFTVQPVLIHVSLSSFINVSPSVLGSNAWSDMLWPFFLPCTFFTLKVLPVMAKSAEESASDFSKRVQNSMATAMGLSSTVYTSSDKLELAKKLRTTASVSASTSHTSSNPGFSHSDQYSQSLHRTEGSLSRDSKVKLTLNTAAKTFGRSSKERMLSYQERKASLIEAAKMKYLEKHSLLNRD